MSDWEDEDDNWLNVTPVTCPGCSADLELIDQSPFDPDCYLYCTDCPTRIDVSPYDQHWRLAQAAVLARDAQLERPSFEQLAIQFEAMVGRCPCGGTYRYAAPRRCLYCACVIAGTETHQHVWPADTGDDAQALEEGEALIERWRREPDWREG